MLCARSVIPTIEKNAIESDCDSDCSDRVPRRNRPFAKLTAEWWSRVDPSGGWGRYWPDKSRLPPDPCLPPNYPAPSPLIPAAFGIAEKSLPLHGELTPVRNSLSWAPMSHKSELVNCFMRLWSRIGFLSEEHHTICIALKPFALFLRKSILTSTNLCFNCTLLFCRVCGQ